MTMKKPHCVHQKQFQYFRDYGDICNLDACLIYQLEQEQIEMNGYTSISEVTLIKVK